MFELYKNLNIGAVRRPRLTAYQVKIYLEISFFAPCVGA